jgi:hypothetical protein
MRTVLRIALCLSVILLLTSAVLATAPTELARAQLALGSASLASCDRTVPADRHAINAAIGAARPYDTICVEPGEDHSYRIDLDKEGITLRAVQPCTFSDRRKPTCATRLGWVEVRASNTTVEGFEFSSRIAIRTGGVSGTRVFNNYFVGYLDGKEDFGVYHFGGARDSTIRGNTFRNEEDGVIFDNNKYDPACLTDDRDPPCHNSGSSTIEDNLFYTEGCSENAIDLKEGAASNDTITIRHNEFWGYRPTYEIPGCNALTTDGAEGAAVVIHMNHPEKVIVEGNYFHDNFTGLRIGTPRTRNVVVVNNVFKSMSRIAVLADSGPSHNLDIYHNTFVDNPDNWFYANGDITRPDLVNNVVLNSGKINYGGPINAHHNLWYHTAGRVDGHDDVNADPRLDTSSAPPYQLTSRSSAINAAADVGITRDYLGNVRDRQPDLGAFEFEGVPGPTDTPPATPGNLTCQTTSAGEAFINTAFGAQRGSFTAEFDARPSADLSDSVVGLSEGSAAGFSSLAVNVRFNRSGNIDARNGNGYQADSVIPYSPNTTYRFKFVVDLLAHTYSVYVTPRGGTQLTLGSDYAFRTEQSRVTELNNWGAYVGANGIGSIEVCNFSLGTDAATSTPTPTPLPIAETELTLCAKRQQLLGCPYEQVVADQQFEAGTLIMTGRLLRNSGDAQLNEHAQIWVDDQRVFASYDQPGLGETELFGPVLVHVEPGVHRVVVRHGDDSANPVSAGSITVNITVAFQIDGVTLTLTPTPTPTPLPIAETELTLCAKRQQPPGCPYEQVVAEQQFEAGTLIMTGRLLRNSGDAQLNEHAQIWVDDQRVFASYDQPGVGNTELFGPVFVHVEPGVHRVVVRHGDDSANPASAGSITVNITVAFQIDAVTLTPTPTPSPSPTSTPTQP